MKRCDLVRRPAPRSGRVRAWRNPPGRLAKGYAEQNNVNLEGLPEDPKADIPPEQIMTVLRSALGMFFPLLVPAVATQQDQRG
jgi:hypothetical protein